MAKKLPIKQTNAVKKNSPVVETCKLTNSMLNSKKPTMKIFWMKLLPAIMRPLLSSLAKN